MSMGGRAEGPACADPIARTSISMSGNLVFIQASGPRYQGWELLLSLVMRRIKKKKESSLVKEKSHHLEDLPTSSGNCTSII
jgi:hypothetical protein